MLRLFSAVLLLAFVVTSPLQAQTEDHVIEQSETPVLIDAFETSTVGRRGTDRITFDVTYRNIRSTDVVAVQFGVVSFGAFDRFLTSAVGTEVAELAPYNSNRATKDISWYVAPPDASRHYTGIAYVSRVRMESGVIWNADREAVLRKIKEQMGVPDLDLPSDTSSAKQEQNNI